MHSVVRSAACVAGLALCGEAPGKRSPGEPPKRNPPQSAQSRRDGPAISGRVCNRAQVSTDWPSGVEEGGRSQPHLSAGKVRIAGGRDHDTAQETTKTAQVGTNESHLVRTPSQNPPSLAFRGLMPPRRPRKGPATTAECFAPPTPNAAMPAVSSTSWRGSVGRRGCAMPCALTGCGLATPLPGLQGFGAGLNAMPAMETSVPEMVTTAGTGAGMQR
ncbi:hypothetical protein M427DRAFT_31175 [Gonapodya prolifera JEL478]|uniref:Uncharacterized protein n=1 Tax=Gonapodya prolifera (strain JEL478) TaxID=1344416 RepID=A0A139AI04_GONPJ|nr:hypothetical protein M427DRAFT_31175 [Gonapodya prolifera JEL478]|eukprot:KXS16446.1 hypothetical protein M427DRAFT_31175 [Gonapodya prolifera JEL478]